MNLGNFLLLLITDIVLHIFCVSWYLHKVCVQLYSTHKFVLLWMYFLSVILPNICVTDLHKECVNRYFTPNFVFLWTHFPLWILLSRLYTGEYVRVDAHFTQVLA